MDEDQRIHEELREQYSLQEHRMHILTSELEETRVSLESNERARKQAESELIDVTERYNQLSVQNAALSGLKRKLETENEQMRGELDDALAEARNADDRAKKAVGDVSTHVTLLYNFKYK